uniref:Putative secreted protein n=1 Tax=Anopheles marajoara TaxID=58244 RepID=A0A2M4CBF0_9DIPT
MALTETTVSLLLAILLSMIVRWEVLSACTQYLCIGGTSRGTLFSNQRQMYPGLSDSFEKKHDCTTESSVRFNNRHVCGPSE